MIYWVLFISMIFSLMLVFIALREDNWAVIIPILIALVFINFVFVPIFMEPHPHVPENYNIPYCPQDHLQSYEITEGIFSNETDIIHEFINHGWNNLTTKYIVHGGFFFGGTDKIIVGQCNH